MGETEQNHYRQAEAALMHVAAAVQRQEQVDLTEVTHLPELLSIHCWKTIS